MVMTHETVCYINKEKKMSLTEPSHLPDKKISSDDDNLGWVVVTVLILSFMLYIAITQ